tara:strand:- start:192 stop:1193 length:1002 start_codon:yes stop_codon:yes gene_type:complete
MLGLAGGLVWTQGPLLPCETPDCFQELIGWWDFSDPEAMQKGTISVDSDGQLSSINETGFADTAGDRVVKITNKAFTVGPLAGLTSCFGKFLYAFNDTRRPTIGTGGAGGNSYIDLAGDTTSQGLLATSRDGFGANQTGAFFNDALSSSVILPNKFTVFVVASSDNATLGSGNFQKMFSFNGGEKNDEGIARGFSLTKTDNSTQAVFSYEGESNEGIASSATNNNTNTRLITFRSAIGSSASTIFHDSSSVGTGTIANDAEIEFLPTGHPNNEQASVEIGGFVNLDASPDSPQWDAQYGFDGKIYEVIVYNKSMNDSEKNILETHLKNKYNIT